MADGSTKVVEHMEVGDRVLAYNEQTRSMTVSEVVSVHRPYSVRFYYVVNDRISLTQNHPILSRGKWISAGDLRVGDDFQTVSLAATPVFSIEKVEADVLVYNFQVALGTYIASGIVVHNKEDCLLYEQVCIGNCGP
ncbi:MAG: hypothetical protein IT349_07570 [Candidatus Eisenbacteria bacterium]|nr:hypothetical protein [Candidatus Eisenbacteria bacterium]MBK8232337.1 hypothetical protein [Candidatus Eisenbacteria bacterium]MCC7141949.1 hypothetical protein [Candidatus Eisenbacteria bacterium]